MYSSLAALFFRNDLFSKAVRGQARHLAAGYAIVLLSGLMLGIENWYVNPQTPEKGLFPLFLAFGIISAMLLHSILASIFWLIGKGFGREGSFMRVYRVMGIAFAPLCLLLIAIDVMIIHRGVIAMNWALVLACLTPLTLFTLYGFARVLITSSQMPPWKALIGSAWVLFMFACVVNVAVRI